MATARLDAGRTLVMLESGQRALDVGAAVAAAESSAAESGRFEREAALAAVGKPHTDDDRQLAADRLIEFALEPGSIAVRAVRGAKVREDPRVDIDRSGVGLGVTAGERRCSGSGAPPASRAITG